METEEEEISVPRLKKFYRDKDPGDPREGQYLGSLKSSQSLPESLPPLGERTEELKSEEIDEEKTWEAVDKGKQKSNPLSSYVDAEEEETW